MIRNYLKIAWRNLTSNRSHSLINLVGLAIGIASCMLIMLWVYDELSYDHWHEKSNRIFRVTNEINFGGTHDHYAVTPAPLAVALYTDFPEVESAVKLRDYGSSLVKREVQSFKENKIIYCDSTLFDVFSFKFIAGNHHALEGPNSLVINESMKTKYFPNDDPIGKTLNFDGQSDYTVTAVVKDLPSNSHFDFDFFVSMTGFREANNGVWLSNNFHTYYALREGVDQSSFEAKVYPYLKDKYIAPQVIQMMGGTYEEFEASGSFIRYHYQPLTDIHLNSDLISELGPNGSMRYVVIFSIAAFFILLIACINFMNLSTARSTARAKEIGVRKVLGSLKSNLINQFLTESILISFNSLVFGLILSFIALPYFNELTTKNLSLPFASIAFWIVTFGGVLMVGALAGSYPAFYLSGFKPIKALSTKFSDKGGNLNLRNGLVIFQFVIATLLIIGTIVINKQVNYIQGKQLGFERNQLLVLGNTSSLGDKAQTLKKELLRNPQIVNATVSGFLPVPSRRSSSPLCKNQDIQEDNCVSIQLWEVDEDYIPTLEMELLQGRNFSTEMGTDSNAVIINEAAAALFDFDNPIGQRVYGGPDFDPQNGQLMDQSTIIGVVKDFHFESLRQNIGPLSMWLKPNTGNLTLKIETQDVMGLIAQVERTWKSVVPAIPFEFKFMDDSFNQIYRSESRISAIISVFSLLSILIACLGLFGLAAFATERRLKEIGIRKVLGASTSNLIGLLSIDFLKLVFISFILSIPLGWYAMSQWLTDFEYRINIDWWIFGLACLLSIVIALATVSFQSIRAAASNPIKSLKSE